MERQSDPWARPGFGSRRRPAVAPSLRLQANAANRSLLRWMRAAELDAWQKADPSALWAQRHLKFKTNQNHQTQR